MTKVEIIDETVAWYSTNPRSDTRAGGCYYFHPNKDAMCAVGRCMDQDHTVVKKLMLDKNVEENSDEIVYLMKKEHVTSINDILQEKYRGHDESFWNALQGLHDHPYYWDDNGLTDVGKNRVKSLKEQYAER